MTNIVRQAVIDKTSVPILRRMLDLSSFRHTLIASNVANVTTPGYVAKTVDFDSELKKALRPDRLKAAVTHPRHIPPQTSKNSAPKVESMAESESTTGINSVDIDREMADLAQNQLVYELAAKLAGKKFRALKSAIRGRPL
jgi:flagellar basal-body rod protein FlgB